MSPILAEFIGTAILVAFGNGVVANVVLAKTKGNGGGWIVITAGWAFAVFVGVFSSQTFSGAHLNPAVTLAMAQAGKFPWADVAGYVLAQMAGGIVGGALVFLFYREHFKATEDGNSKLACFCTAPNIRNLGQAFFCEVVGTFLLVLPVFLMTDARIKLPAAGAPPMKSLLAWARWGHCRWVCWCSRLGYRSGERPATRSTPRATWARGWRIGSCPSRASGIAIGAMPGCRLSARSSVAGSRPVLTWF